MPGECLHYGMDWNLLRATVYQGIRNATLMAGAPNAKKVVVAGTTPGIDARFAQVFSRNKISGKYLDVNHNLVKDLKNMGLWDRVKDLIIENQGDISQIDGIPQYIKDIYKTSFTTSPLAYIEVAARAQKWVDQALSRNMYLETRDIDETMNIYMTAWEKGLKSTYYLHMKPRHTAEQSTVRVNKAEKMGKKGFGGVAKAITMEEIVPQVSPITVAEPVLVTPAQVEAQKEIEQGPALVAAAAPHTARFTDLASFKMTEPAPLAPTPAAPVSAPSAGGFAKVAPKVINVSKVCPTDPAERAQCDSCQ
jgi:ribonucleoside-diphosphate reductase alpha chain